MVKTPSQVSPPVPSGCLDVQLALSAGYFVLKADFPLIIITSWELGSDSLLKVAGLPLGTQRKTKGQAQQSCAVHICVARPFSADGKTYTWTDVSVFLPETTHCPDITISI